MPRLNRTGAENAPGKAGVRATAQRLVPRTPGNPVAPGLPGVTLTAYEAAP